MAADRRPLPFFMRTERTRALAAIFSGHGEPFRLKEFPIPAPGAGELLVEITCSTICGSDLHTWHGRREEPTPCVLGHEIVGRIVAFGAGAPRIDLKGQPIHEGDRITWTLAASCGECFFCRRGLPQKCEHLFKYGHSAIAPGREFSGGFAECCLLSAGTGVVRVPDPVSDTLAAPANCAVATVAAACRLGGPLEGSSVAVLGAGVLGLTACAMARALGAAEVVACDLDPDREALALDFGASRFATPDELGEMSLDLTAGRGADISMEFSGAAEAVRGALDVTRTGGTAIIAGTTTPGQSISLDPNQLVRRMLNIRGLHNYAPTDLVSAMDFLGEHGERFPFEQLGGGRFDLERIDNAFRHSSEHPGLRTAILP